MTSFPLHAPPDRRGVGIGWRQPHEQDLLERRPPLGFIEVHSENFFGDGGAALAALQRARTLYPISLHGVGLALGSAVGLDPWHLERLAALVQRIDPVRVSDHACFARAPVGEGGAVVHGSDLLPIAFDEPTLARMVRHVQQVQERLKRPILVENLSAYLKSTHDALAEAEFFNALAHRSGCGVLLDVNNLVVNALNAQGACEPGGTGAAGAAALNEGQAAEADEAEAEAVLPLIQRFLQALDPTVVGQMHLAGHARVNGWAIDDHGSRVPPLVWRAYGLALRRCGPVPTLIEWDTDVPAFEVLLAEADAAAQAQGEARMGRQVHAGDGAVELGAGWAGVAVGDAATHSVIHSDTHSASARLAAEGVPPRALASPQVADPASGEPRHPDSAQAQAALLAALWTPVGSAPSGALGSGREAGQTAQTGQTTHAVRAQQTEPRAQTAVPQPASGIRVTEGPALPAGWCSVRPTARRVAPSAGVGPLDLYRSHARALARRALAAAYPTVSALVGEAAWSAVARRHWLEAPPERGDLSEWGVRLPQALADDAQLADCPYLPDVARLDWAVHRAALAADAPADPLDLQALARVAPDRLRLHPVPGAALVVSRWPVVRLWRAHQRDSGVPLSEAAQALQHGLADTAWVWRPAGAWRVQVQPLGAADAACCRALLHGAVLADALDAALAVDAAWRFDQWLVQAIGQGWLARMASAAPAPGPSLVVSSAHANPIPNG